MSIINYSAKLTDSQLAAIAALTLGRQAPSPGLNNSLPRCGGLIYDQP